MCFLVQEPEENVNMINNYYEKCTKALIFEHILKKKSYSKENMKYLLAVPTFGLEQFFSIFN